MAKTTIGANSVVFDSTAGGAGTVAEFDNSGGGAPADITVNLVHGLNAHYPNELKVSVESSLHFLGQPAVVEVDANTIAVVVEIDTGDKGEAIVRCEKHHSLTK